MPIAHKRKQKKQQTREPEPPRRSHIGTFLLLFLLVTGLTFAGSLYMRTEVIHRLKNQTIASSSVVFSRAFALTRGTKLTAAKLPERAERLGYHKVARVPERRGEYMIGRDAAYIFLRGGLINGSEHQPEQLVQLRLSPDGVISDITALPAERELDRAWLEPEILSLVGESSIRAELPKSLDEFNPLLVKAVLAIEDERFYAHFGIDPLAIMRAATANFRSHRVVQGGSTITQQLAKNLFLDSSRSIVRKLKEAVAAVLIETAFSKDQILEMYLNQVFLGQEGRVAIHGFGEASRSFFDKDAADLSLSESAILAGMIKGPTRYSPRRYPDRAKKRKSIVLQALADQGKITERERAEADKQQLNVVPAQRNKRNAPYFIDYVRREVQNFLSTEDPEAQALHIYSGIDVQMQDCAEKAVRQGLKRLESTYKWMTRAKEPIQAALVATTPSSGETIAWVGGRNYAKNQFDRVSQAKRQPGSSFKPFVYLTALDKDLNTYRVARTTNTLIDEPITLQVAGSGAWEPKNYDNEYHGEVTLREALMKSLNIPTVNLAMKVGINNVARTAALFGFGENLPHVPSLALGAGEVSPLDLARAYGGIANGGSIVDLRPVLAIIKANDEAELYQSPLTERRVASEPAVYVLTTMLRSVIEHGTGQAVRRLGFTAPAAGKTGTSNDSKDAWFVGFTPRILAVVWVGFDDPRELNLTGAAAAAPIWTDFMRCASEMEPQLDFVPPPGVVFAKVDKQSGLLDEGYCPPENVVNEVFVEGTEPVTACPLHSPQVEEAADETEEGYRTPADPRRQARRIWPPERRPAAQPARDRGSFWDKLFNW